jgi:uncharacterized protein
MGIIIIGLTAFFASLLTFFSGFGLGTLLTPVFAIFFPAEVAVAQTSVVHFINNLFKLLLTGKHINKSIVLRFGLPAVLGALAGAYALLFFAKANPLFIYYIGDKECIITPIKIIIGLMIIVFSIIEFLPAFSKTGFAKNNLFIGGILSGFFGGLSGHQGALRSAFLIKYNLPKEQYIATGTAIACIIDVTRISLYATMFIKLNLFENNSYILFASVCAIAGAITGNFLLKKITLKFVQTLTHILLIILALAIGSGLI